MKKVRTLRLICVIVLALILLVASLFILLPRRNDAKSGRAAVCFIHEELLFPQMDMSQLFSRLDIASYYVVENGLSQAEMEAQVKKVLGRKRIDSVVLVCEGNYARSGLSIASAEPGVSDLILLSPDLPASSELGEIGAKVPACRVSIFSSRSTVSDSLYERLSGEDTKLARGVRADEAAPELYISSDAMRYYARLGEYPNSEVASVVTMNSPVMQTYLANYLMNHTLGKKGTSRVPLWTWVMKTVCTVITLAAFFLYASTLPASRKFTPAKNGSEGRSADRKHRRPAPAAPGDPVLPSAPGSEDESELPRDHKGRIRGRSIAEKYRSALNHLLALELLLGAAFSLPALYFVARKNSAYRVVILLWICFSFLSSAFFLMPYIHKLKGRKVRSSRSMWPVHLGFTVLLAADIFMLTLLWKGAGFLRLNLLLIIAIVLSVLVGFSMAMLQLTDNFFGKIQGSNQSVLDSVKFSAIRFVPMVIVFTFSIIMGRELYAVQVVLLALSLLGASYLRRVIRKGAWGEILSVILFSALYWMMF